MQAHPFRAQILQHGNLRYTQIAHIVQLLQGSRQSQIELVALNAEPLRLGAQLVDILLVGLLLLQGRPLVQLAFELQVLLLGL